MSFRVFHLMTADVTRDVTAQLHDGDLEVSQWFPGLSGKLLIDAIMRACIEPMTRTIPFFSSSVERLPFRHAKNKHEVVEKRGVRAHCSWPAMVYAQGTNQHR